MQRLNKVLLSVLLASVATSPLAKQRDADADAEKQEISRLGQVNLGLAQSYLESNDLETALDRAMRALRSDPKSADVHAMLGLIYSRISQPEKATGEFAKAVQLAPTNGSILNVDGVWLCQQGQTEAADAQFAKALQDPFYKQPEQALFNAGKCAYKAGQLQKAEAYLRNSLGKAPDQPETLLTLAQVEFAQGNYMDARAFVQRRDAMGSSPDVLDLAARIEEAAGDPRAAEQYRQRSRDAASVSANGDGVKQP